MIECFKFNLLINKIRTQDFIIIFGCLASQLLTFSCQQIRKLQAMAIPQAIQHRCLALRACQLFTIHAHNEGLPKSKSFSVPHLEFFWAYRYMYRNWYFSASIGDRTVRETNRQKVRLYLAALRCQTTKQFYKIIREEEWTVIKLIKVKKNW